MYIFNYKKTVSTIMLLLIFLIVPIIAAISNGNYIITGGVCSFFILIWVLAFRYYSKCPNCGKEVILTEYFKSFYHWEDECEYYYKTSKGSCDACKISYDDGNWIIPEELQPTEKQKRTVMFIRNRLNPPLDDLGITKQSYIKFIGKYFEQAKKTPLPSPMFSDELDELYDLLPDPGFFC